MGIMHIQNFGRKLLHFHCHKLESTLFETGNHFTCQTSLKSSGLDYHQCPFHNINCCKSFELKVIQI